MSPLQRKRKYKLRWPRWAGALGPACLPPSSVLLPRSALFTTNKLSIHPPTASFRVCLAQVYVLETKDLDTALRRACPLVTAASATSKFTVSLGLPQGPRRRTCHYCSVMSSVTLCITTPAQGPRRVGGRISCAPGRCGGIRPSSPGSGPAAPPPAPPTPEGHKASGSSSHCFPLQKDIKIFKKTYS